MSNTGGQLSANSNAQGRVEDKLDSSLYWIKGYPGAGKSTLMKYALPQDRKHTSFVTGQDSLIE
jgi:putative ribosome biogenesis GTPase RsgA